MSTTAAPPGDVACDIAIVGLSACFPGSTDRTGFWRDIVAGIDRISDVPPTHWLIDDYYSPDFAEPDKVYAKRGGFLPSMPFDPMAFGILPKALPATDSSQLLALLVARSLLDEVSRGDLESLDRDRTSVILGVASATELVCSMSARLQRPVWERVLGAYGLAQADVESICQVMSEQYVPWQESTFPGLLGNVIAGRIANRFDLGGTNCVVDAACASSFSALAMGANELALGQCDLAITGGVDALNDILMYACFGETTALSASGDCRPFDTNADGTLLGEGIGMFALRRLADAERDGDSIYAVIKGIGSSSDGRAKSIYGPLPAGQALALGRAYQQAGYSPRTVELMEAHGTGTVAGDAAELDGLSKVFEVSETHSRWCALGSVKSQIGHTKAAAGAAGLFKVVMALHQKTLPPTIKVDQPNDRLAQEPSPFYLNTRARPWFPSEQHPRRGSVSAFGFGGTNFHLTLEEYRGPAPRPPSLRALSSELVLFSADSRADLDATLDRELELLRERDADPWWVLRAHDSQLEFNAEAQHRLALVVRDNRDLEVRLEQARQHLASRPEHELSSPNGIHYGAGAAGPTGSGKMAFLFPGQGSQYLYMGASLVVGFDTAMQVWERVPRHLAETVFPQPEWDTGAQQRQTDRLTAMEAAQPAIGAMSASMLVILSRLGLDADLVAGHSFGEVTALYAAGVMDLPGMLEVAARRGALMADAAAQAESPGAMVAVVASDAQVGALIESHGLDLVIANHNAPRQVVLSGALAEIERAEKVLATADLASHRLPVASAFHSPVVASSTPAFYKFLEGISLARPALPVYGNADASTYPVESEAIRHRLAEQLSRPVRFTDVVRDMHAAGARAFVEVGPGDVLTKLVGQCLEGQEHLAVATDRRGQPGVEAFWSAIGRLAVAGRPMRFDGLWGDHALPERPLERQPQTVDICGSNFAKPYPPREQQMSSLTSETPAAPSSPAAASDPPVARDTTGASEQQVSPASAGPPQPPAAPSPYPDGAYGEDTPVMLDNPQAGGGHASNEHALASFEHMHARLAQVQLEFQRTMTNSHHAYLSLVASAIGAQLPGLPAPDASLSPSNHSGSVFGDALPGLSDPVHSAFPSSGSGPPLAPSPANGAGTPEIRTREVRPATSHAMEPPPVATPSPPPLPEPQVPSEANLVDESVGGAGNPDVSPALDVGDRLLEIVADKTGYPKEMLELDMEVEASLGIDSIKRVEILAALQDELESAQDVDTAALGAMRTLQEISDHIEAMVVPDRGQRVDSTVAPSPVAADGEAQARVSSFDASLGPVSSPPASRASPLERQSVAGLATPASGEPLAGWADVRCVAITDDGRGVAGALAERLEASGIEALVVTEGSRELPVDALICLDGLSDIDDCVEVHRRVLAAARRAAPEFSRGGGIFVTVQDTGGDFGWTADSTSVWRAGISAIAKTAAKEWPECAVKAIDIESAGRSPETLADCIVAELASGGPSIEAGLTARGDRLEPQVSRLPESGSCAGPLDCMSMTGAPIVVSGGARGITARVLIEYARKYRPKILILGRTVLRDEPAALVGTIARVSLEQMVLDLARVSGEALTPAELSRRVAEINAAREVRATISELEQIGSTVRYETVDICNSLAVSEAIAKARDEFGPIRGVIHGAGVIDDALIEKKTDAQFDRVFRTKVDGLRTLLAATRDDPVSRLALFGSIAARNGNPGQADYAAANQVLVGVARREARLRGEQCIVKALGFGPWSGGMVDATLAERFRARGVALIPTSAGAVIAAREIDTADCNVEVLMTARSLQDVS